MSSEVLKAIGCRHSTAGCQHNLLLPSSNIEQIIELVWNVNIAAANIYHEAVVIFLSHVYVFSVFFFFNFIFGPHPVMLKANSYWCSGTLWIIGNRTQVCHMQYKDPTYCIISVAPNETVV